MADASCSVTRIKPKTDATPCNPSELQSKQLLDDDNYTVEYPTTWLCSFCQNIFDHWTDISETTTGDRKRGENKKMVFQHHQNKAALTASACQGCGLCYQFSRSCSADTWDITSGSAVEINSQIGKNWKLRLYSSRSGASLSKVEMFPTVSRCKSLVTVLYSFVIQAPLYLHEFMALSTYSWLANKPKFYRGGIMTNLYLAKTHKRCNVMSEGQVPTRLIFVGDVDPRLRLSTEIVGVVAYATLSHCWGAKEFLTLKTTNIAIFQIKIPADAITKTFRHAIAISRYLGLQYLWIDSLCIIQDDPDDWRREAGLMEQVYGGSTINLSASGACDGSVGCFFERPNSWRSQFKLSTDPTHLSESELCFDCVPESLGTLVSGTPLAQRAWAVQERILPHRNLFFTEHEVFWECEEKSACETFPSGLPEGMVGRAWTPSGPKVDSTLGIPPPWFNLVRHYSQCNLSKSQDKLVAFAGVARRWKSIIQENHDAGLWHGPLPGKYLAGLWKGHLPLGLCWKVEFPKERIDPYVAPTWSWASHDGMVQGPDTRWEDADILVNVQEIFLKHVSTDSFGAVSAATLRLACKLLFGACLKRHHPAKSKFAAYTIKASGKKFRGKIMLDIQTSSDLKLLDVFVLPVVMDRSKATKCLVLSRIDNTKGRYERLGLATGSWTDEAPCGSTLQDSDYIESVKDIDGIFRYNIDII